MGIGINTGFKKIENSINFCLICIIVLWGISIFMFIGDMITIPKRGEDPGYIFGYNYMNDVSYKPVKDFWTIKTGDNKITNIENIVIWIFFLWGWLRFIDLERFLENYKKDI